MSFNRDPLARQLTAPRAVAQAKGSDQSTSVDLTERRRRRLPVVYEMASTCSEQIAGASGGIFGTRLRSVTDEERALAKRIASDLTARRTRTPSRIPSKTFEGPFRRTDSRPDRHTH